MADERGSRVLAKLILLEQACCDPRLDSSAKGTLAVVLDACYDKPSCFIGPTAIGEIAGFNEKTVRIAIGALVDCGYLRTEPRNKRSTFLLPNFDYAERSGCLVNRADGKQRVSRPVNRDYEARQLAGTHARNHWNKKRRIAGVGVRNSGRARPKQRAPMPDEAVQETIQEAVGAARGFSSYEERQQQRQEQERVNREKQICDDYRAAKETDHRLARILEREHWRLLTREGLVEEGQLPVLKA